MKTTRRSGNVLLVIIFLLSVTALVLLAWKLIYTLQRLNPDPNHGQSTNAEPDTSWSGSIASLSSNYPVVYVPDFNLTLPVESLAYQWNLSVQTSTNLRDWTDLDVEWDEALEAIRTNHNEPCRFYRRVLWW